MGMQYPRDMDIGCDERSKGTAGRAGAFCISLDFELMWGAKEKWAADGYGHRVLGERQAVPRMLDSFERHGVHATWAAVGMACCSSLDELFAALPEERPTYEDPAMSSYAYLDQIGKDERRDPLHFGASLLERVRQTPGQEIGTHTFSHFYTLEPGATLQQFEADLAAARRLAENHGVNLRSIVFPRNQYGHTHLGACARQGLIAFRGVERAGFYRSRASREASGPIDRAGRLVDSYLDLTGAHGSWPGATEEGLWNIASSRFLRPYAREAALADPLKLNRIASAMRACAKAGEIYHLWWHPHNFGADVAENIAFLDSILAAFARLREEFGFAAMSMGELADALTGARPDQGRVQGAAA